MANIVAHIGKHKYQTTITNQRHTLVADEPAELDGSDLGPTPDELLMMSLASCTAITLRMYADRKQWALDEIEVHVSMSKQADKTVFERSIHPKGELTEEQTSRLIQIAKACPVHKILTTPIEINTTLG